MKTSKERIPSGLHTSDATTAELEANPWATIDRLKQELYAVEAAVARWPGWVLLEPLNGRYRAECRSQIPGFRARCSGRDSRELEAAIEERERSWDEQVGL